MILLINLIPAFILAAGSALYWRLRDAWIIAATFGLLALYAMAHPSYMPKGQISRSEIPAFSASGSQIEDRNSKPMSGSERDERMAESVKRGLDFIEKPE